MHYLQWHVYAHKTAVCVCMLHTTCGLGDSVNYVGKVLTSRLLLVYCRALCREQYANAWQQHVLPALHIPDNIACCLHLPCEQSASKELHNRRTTTIVCAFRWLRTRWVKSTRAAAIQDLEWQVRRLWSWQSSSRRVCSYRSKKPWICCLWVLGWKQST